MFRARDALFAAALLVALSACGAAPPPPVPVAPKAQVEQAIVAPVPTTAPATAPEPAQVIHRSEIYGSVVARRGKVLELLSLLMTSSTLPPIGVKALLFRKAGKKDSNDWIPIGEVTLQKMEEGGKIELELSDELLKGKLEILKKDLSIKLQIDR